PHDRLPRSFPTDAEAASRRGVADVVVMRQSQRSRDLAEADLAALEVPVEALGELLESAPIRLVIGHPSTREDRDVARRNDVRAKARSPYLDERSVLPGR